MADNVTLNAGVGGATIRTVSDSGGNEWPVGVCVYATSTTPGAGTFQFVGTGAGLPVAQQGTWNVGTLTSITDTVTVSGTVAVSGSVAVTGTFWQATQPVSGTFWQATQPVSIAASVTVAQATAASLNATVVGTGTFAVQAAQSGTWNIGTVTTVWAVTAISNALPAGTNLLGSIAQSPQIASADNGITAATVQYASFSTSSSGATTIVAAVGGKKVYALRWSVSGVTATRT